MKRVKEGVSREVQAEIEILGDAGRGRLYPRPFYHHHQTDSAFRGAARSAHLLLQRHHQNDASLTRVAEWFIHWQGDGRGGGKSLKESNWMKTMSLQGIKPESVCLSAE